MISGVVLAAGTGSRFGGTKQMATVDGKPLAQHAIDALEAAGVDEVIVVTGHDAVKVASALTLPSHGRIVYNPAFKDGQATSLAAAIHALDDESEAAVILMADQPGVTSDVIRALVERFRATRRQVVRAMYDNGPDPPCCRGRSMRRPAICTATWGHASDRVAPRVGGRGRADGPAPVDIDLPSDLSP